MKRRILLTFLCLMLLSVASGISDAQDAGHFRRIVEELSSSKYHGRGYARDGVLKAGDYIYDELGKAGADEVIRQPFKIDVNTFPGRMKLSVDGRRMIPGEDFVLREYSPGMHGEASLYYIDTLHYDANAVLRDLSAKENEGCLVVCDFWFAYRHRQDFRKMESSAECLNGGMIYIWDTPLKFYKAYAEKVVAKPQIWVSSDFPVSASRVKADIDNEFLEGYRSDNVIAKVEGRRHDSCFVFTAHYDHLGNLGRRLYYPGANDNASGTAGIITLAEHYASHRPDFDMYFIAFSGEDTNLRGSTWFIEHPTFPIDRIRYLFNLDMIGDNNPVQYCEVSDSGSSGFALMEQINAESGFFRSLHRGELAANSDHWPFAQHGVACILFENENGDAFPYYHTAKDDMTTVRFETFDPLMRLITSFIGRY